MWRQQSLTRWKFFRSLCFIALPRPCSHESSVFSTKNTSADFPVAVIRCFHSLFTDSCRFSTPKCLTSSLGVLVYLIKTSSRTVWVSLICSYIVPFCLFSSFFPLLYFRFPLCFMLNNKDECAESVPALYLDQPGKQLIISSNTGSMSDPKKGQAFRLFSAEYNCVERILVSVTGSLSHCNLSQSKSDMHWNIYKSKNKPFTCVGVPRQKKKNL